jgi:hypothetical protein
MVEGKTKGEKTNASDYRSELRDKIKKCQGVLCFEPDGIHVKVDKAKNLECAKLVDKYLLSGKKVTFELEENVEIVDK